MSVFRAQTKTSFDGLDTHMHFVQIIYDIIKLQHEIAMYYIYIYIYITQKANFSLCFKRIIRFDAK